MKLPIYLDYSATTPVDPRVADKMTRYLTLDGIFGNPSSRFHRYGWEAEEAVDVARNQVASLVGADPREIVFTSGATESDNLALKGAALANSTKGRHIITSITEHQAVIDTCYQLEKEGFTITWLIPPKNGIITPQQLSDSLREDTILVSLMHVNNEIGTIQDIKAFGELCQEQGALFHVDATQSVGKLPINLSSLPIDLMSFSSHKLYGPKGIGGLFVRHKPKRIPIKAQMHGGGHELGMRSGTLPVHQIVGMGEAYKIAAQEMGTEMPRLNILRDHLWQGIRKIDGVSLNGDLHHSIVTLLNVSFRNVDGEALIMAMKDLAISSGSACHSASTEPSYVLRAIGLEEELAYSAIRLSLGRFTTFEEIQYAVTQIQTATEFLRREQRT